MLYIISLNCFEQLSGIFRSIHIIIQKRNSFAVKLTLTAVKLTVTNNNFFFCFNEMISK